MQGNDCIAGVGIVGDSRRVPKIPDDSRPDTVKGAARATVSASAIWIDEPLLMGASPDVAFKWLRVLHIRPNLPENWPRFGRTKKSMFGVGNAGSTYVVLF
jgi:hypothetical protein